MSIIDTDEGLIAFDTGDTKHDGELMLEALRTVSDKPVKAIIYGHSHTYFGAGVLAEGNPARHNVECRLMTRWRSSLLT
jgi:alkyl sulfatase BDS1-like metallo-beta-lactamase superfamily hydrolase